MPPFPRSVYQLHKLRLHQTLSLLLAHQQQKLQGSFVHKSQKPGHNQFKIAILKWNLGNDTS